MARDMMVQSLFGTRIVPDIRFQVLLFFRRVENSPACGNGVPGHARISPRPMFEDDDELIRQKIHELKLEHRALDVAVRGMLEGAYVDQLQVRRLKKRKLELKDLIRRLQSELIPDLDA